MSDTDDAVQAFQTGSASAFRRAIDKLFGNSNGGSSPFSGGTITDRLTIDTTSHGATGYTAFAVNTDLDETSPELMATYANAERAVTDLYSDGSFFHTIWPTGIVLVRDSSFNVLWMIEGNGNVSLPSLPTADPVSAGALWNDAGTLKVSAG